MTAGRAHPDVVAMIENLDVDGRLKLHSTLLTLPFDGVGTFDWTPYITPTGSWITPPPDPNFNWVTPWTVLTRFGRGDSNWEGVQAEFPWLTYEMIKACAAWGFASGKWIDSRSLANSPAVV